MRVLLIRASEKWRDVPTHPENSVAPISLGILAAMLEQSGHHVSLLDTETARFNREEARAEVRTADAELFVVQGTTPDHQAMREFAAVAREGKHCVGGIAVGQHPTVLPFELHGEDSPFDACVRGEFEEAAFEALTRLATGEELQGIAGLALPGETSDWPAASLRMVENPDALPMALHRLFSPEHYRMYHPLGLRRRLRWGFVLTARGCPFRCIYCSPTLRVSYGKKLRFRSPESVGEELQHLAARGINSVFFHDDTLTVSRPHIEAVCEQIRQRGLQRKIAWIGQTRADCLDRGLIRTLARSGCRTLCFGVEAGDDETLARLGKDETVEQMEAAFRLCREAGMRTVGYFLLGCPGQSIEAMEGALRLCKQLKPDLLQVAFFTPYPGSPHWDSLPAAERPGVAALSHYNRPTDRERMTASALAGLQRRFYREYLLTPGFAWRFLWAKSPIGLLLNLDRELDFFWRAGRFLFLRRKNND